MVKPLMVCAAELLLVVCVALIRMMVVGLGGATRDCFRGGAMDKRLWTADHLPYKWLLILLTISKKFQKYQFRLNTKISSKFTSIVS